MKIERHHELTLDAATAARIAALLDLVFDGGFGPRGRFLHRHHMRLVVEDGPRVIGHLALGLRVVRLGPEVVDVATLAEVATHPERRGAGIAGALLADALAVARGSGAAFALLFGAAGLYRAAGFRPVSNPVRRVDMAGRVTHGVVDGPIADLMMLPMGDMAWDETLPLDLLGAKF